MSFESVENLLCSKTHEYVYQDGNIYIMGVTDYAVEQMGDIVFVELPEVGSEFGIGEVFGTLESVKAASELFAPVSCKIVEVNEELVTKPEILNADSYKDGWLCKIELTNVEELDTLMEYEDYKSELN